MKKTIALLLLFASLLTVSSCGGSARPETTTNNEQTSLSETNSPSDTAPVGIASENESEAAQDVDDEMTVLNDDNCLVRVSDFANDELWGITIDLYCENKTESSPYRVEVEAASVNGVEVDALFSCEISPGKSKNDSISITPPDDLSDASEFTDIELVFSIYNANLPAASATKKEFHIYPAGIENATSFERSPGAKDIVIIDNDDVSVTVVGFGRDSLYECMVNLFIENKTGKDLDFSASDVKLNGKDCDPMFSVTVRAGRSAFRSIGWLHSTLWEKYIWDVSDISLTITAAESGDPEKITASESAKFNAPSGLGAT